MMRALAASTLWNCARQTVMELREPPSAPRAARGFGVTRARVACDLDLSLSLDRRVITLSTVASLSPNLAQLV